MSNQITSNGNSDYRTKSPAISNSSSKEDTEDSLSPLSNSVVRPKVEGNDFLKHLRAAGAFDAHLHGTDTIGPSKQKNTRQDLATLSELFENPNLDNLNHISNDETIGAHNRTGGRQNLAPLSDLFAGPPPSVSAGPVVPMPSVPEDPKNLARTSSWSPSKPALKKTAPAALSPSPLASSDDGDATFPNQTAGFRPPPRQPPVGVHHHSRSVSWGNNTTIPVLAESIKPRRENSQSDDSFDSVSSLGADHRRTNTQTHLTLEDIMTGSPYENEAETNIIRAMESQQSNRDSRVRTSSASSSLALSQVQGPTAHDFTLEGDENVDASPVRPKEREKVPLMNANVNKRHRRHQSVEQTLAGLTSAMTALHGNRGNKKENNRYLDEPFSSADAFAENATRLSEQQNEDGSFTAARRKSNWKFDNLPVVREDKRDPGANDEDDSDSGSDADDDHDDIEAQNPDIDDSTERRTSGSGSGKRRATVLRDASDTLKSEWEAWGAFFRPRKAQIATYIKHALIYLILPLVGIAAILFYFCGNPQTGMTNRDVPSHKASVSWWLLFAVREVVTFSLALAVQGLIVDFLALGTRIMLRVVGPVITLLIVQSKGWPFICFWWAILDITMLWGGNSEFANHWGYWQDLVELFNKTNPSGTVVNSKTHTTILKIVVSVSVVVAVKRFVIGLYLGRQTFTHYGQQLAKEMNSMLLVSEVAGLAKDIERSKIDHSFNIPVRSEAFGFNGQSIADIVFSNDDNTVSTQMRSVDASEKTSDNVIDTTLRDPLTGSLRQSEKAKLMQLLGQWEEPSKAYDPRQVEIASISAVLRFRKALTFIKKRYPFSYAFGTADTRETCIDSAQKVYQRLLMRTPNEEVMPFETIALLAVTEEGLDQQKAKDLVKLFRPDRDGSLTMLDFVKSVDDVYRGFRMLQASIDNSSQIDRAFENIFNTIFYSIIVTVILSELGFNPFALFLSLSSVILAFAFMIGSASSKYFEGLLFILVRRPYGIGDRIHVSGVEKDTSLEGVPGWVVEHVTLFETIATWTPTQERCSLSNGSLASSRIINAARSRQAQFNVFLKFPIDTPYEKILIFKTAIEEFMKARPREWLALYGFRASRIVADQGFVEYAIVIRHRNNWQNIGLILDSKANLSSYCNEVAKQLNMHYRAPPLPVDLRYAHISQLPMSQEGAVTPKDNNFDTAVPAEEMDREAHIREFRQLALNKHNIRLN